jgi:hypothetical protein
MAEANEESASIELTVQPPVEDIKNLILTIRGSMRLQTDGDDEHQGQMGG